MKSRWMTLLGAATLGMTVATSATAALEKRGAWPAVDKTVSLDFEGKPTDGLKALAKEADWSLVIRDGVLFDGKRVEVDVDEQPADAVLDALFAGQNVIADRSGSLVTIRPSTTAAKASGEAPQTRGEDRHVFGGNLVIGKGETVHTVTVAGGSLRVEGTVTGDLVVAGGTATVASGAHVLGDATALGGKLDIENDARVDGDVGVVGGVLTRADGAIVGGKIVDDDHPGDVKVSVHDDDVETHVTSSNEPPPSRFSAAVHAFGGAMTKMALLFVLGCVLLTLLTERMEKVQAEVASRPMHSFATGVVASVVGGLGATVLVVALCISIVGIPVAIASLLAAIFALYAAMASTLTTVGRALVAHRSKNPYVHLLVGCGLFLIASLVPWVGGVVTFTLVITAIGVLVRTRAGSRLAPLRSGMST